MKNLEADLKQRAVKIRAISGLRPYKRNARTHPPAQIEQIKASLERFGFTNPILIDKHGEVIAGHGRLLAAEALGLKRVPAIELSDLTPDEAKAYRLADNAIAERSGWDLDLLSEEFNSLDGAFDGAALLGFNADQMALFDSAVLGEVEAAEALPPTGPARAKPGDLWSLGNHRVKCGDATNADDVADCLGGAEPHLMVTDPPYGVAYDADWRNRHRMGGCAKKPTRAVGKVPNDDRVGWCEAWELFPGTVAYVWHASLFSDQALGELRTAGFVPRAQIVWVKSGIVVGRGHYHWQHEPCWYAVRKGKTGHWNGSRKQSTVWEITHIKSETGHSTQKPIEAMRRPIMNNSKKGDAIYDPFLGSGTTLIACQAEGRVCYGLEIDPVYVDMTLARWEELTGEKAVKL